MAWVEARAERCAPARVERVLMRSLRESDVRSGTGEVGDAALASESEGGAVARITDCGMSTEG